MKILVTGAAGFIGYHLCSRLIENHHEVIGFDNINDYYDQNLKLDRIEQLNKKGAIIDFSDPFFDKIPETRKYSFEIKSAPIRKDSLLNYDLVILLTDHDEYDYAMIEENAKMIIDTRGKFSNENKKVRKA